MPVSQITGMEEEDIFADFDFSVDPDLAALIDSDDDTLGGTDDRDILGGIDLPFDPDLVARLTSELSQWEDETLGLPKRVTIFQCPDCESYFQPPQPDDPPNRKRWIIAEPQSTELLEFCVRRLKPYLKPLMSNSTPLRLILSNPHFTPSSDAMIAVSITMIKGFPSGTFHHYVYSVEYDVRDRICDSCYSIRGTSDQSCSAKEKDDLEQQLSNLRPFVPV